jgi:glycosyltransferase involved in cell wall biosynthesis
MTSADSLIGLVNPQPNSTIMIYDVHASESGALAILDDLYKQIRNYSDKSVKWVFIVSTPEYEETKEITVRRFPWVKRNWGYRYYFDTVTTRKLLKKFKPDKVFSLQNKGIDFYKKEQLVYLHLPFILTDHKFDIKVDGKKLWAYQNIISKSIFKSLRKVDMTIVQTEWMKEALVKKAGVNTDKIVVQQPDIKCNDIKDFVDCPENRKRIFYPATAFTYKNHSTLLKALRYATENGLKDYEVIFTTRPDENAYTQNLYKYATEHNLNVKFNGPIPREKVFEMYARSVLVFPSYVESFGLPLLEAKLSGTYIMASDTPFCHEILDGYDKAEFFEELDYLCLGKLLLELGA